MARCNTDILAELIITFPSIKSNIFYMYSRNIFFNKHLNRVEYVICNLNC